MGVAVGTDIAEVDCVWNLARRLAGIVLANADRWILVASAAGHGNLIPSDSVVRGHSGTVVARTREARRIGHIDGALWRYLDVSMNTAEAHRRIENRNCRGKSLPAVIATRALCLGQAL